MVKKLALFSVLALLLSLCLALPARAQDEEQGIVKLTFNNKTDQKVQVAVIYAGFDSPDDRKIGWYIIESGKARTINLAISPFLTMESTGYYAQSQPGPGQKKLVWRGDFKKLSVTNKKFNAPQDQVFAEGWVAGFRQIKLKRANELSSTPATATINLTQ